MFGRAAPKLRQAVATLAVFLLLSLAAVTSQGHAQGIFGQPGSGGGIFGGGGFGAIFGGARQVLQGIFGGRPAPTLGGARLYLSPGGPVPTPNPILPPPLPNAANLVKVWLEWDALTVGPDQDVAAGPNDPFWQVPNQDGKTHEEIVGGQDCDCSPPSDPTPTPLGPTPTPSQCRLKPVDIKHVLYGWCGSEPDFIHDDIQKCEPNRDDCIPLCSQGVDLRGRCIPEDSPGPNDFTLPSAVSNKYIRRDGYWFKYDCDPPGCSDKCLTQSNYLEFQTLVESSNLMSMYVGVQNQSNHEIKNVQVSTSNLLYLKNDPVLPHSLEYPTRFDVLKDPPARWEHGHNLSRTSPPGQMAQLATPFDLAAGASYIVPLQPEPANRCSIPLSEGNPAPCTSDPYFRTSFEGCGALPPRDYDFIKDAANAQPEADAVVVDNPDYYRCVGEKLANYMNAVCGAGVSGVGLLSPVFNVSSYTFDPIVEAMKQAGANFSCLDGIAVNLYNDQYPSGSISHYVGKTRSQFGAQPLYITETGMLERDLINTPKSEALKHLRDELGQVWGDIQAALLFNSFNTNPDPRFWYNQMSDDEIGQYACQGSCSKIGINSAAYFNQGTGFYQRAGNLGMGYILEIAKKDSLHQAVTGINLALSRGLTPIVRIGVMMDHGGFENPGDYIDWLREVRAQTTGDFLAIAGPNEPDLEHWLTTDCGAEQFIIRDELKCVAREFRDVTELSGCGYEASSNNSVIGPIQVEVKYGQTGSSRSILVASVPIGGQIADDEARPFGWPASGRIRQDWGKTDQAAVEGNFRSKPNQLYTDYIACPLEGKTYPEDRAPNQDRLWLHPGIDIEPLSDEQTDTGVYATHAGFITFAGDAGQVLGGGPSRVESGVTVQIESDVNQDNDPDYATRYSHLTPGSLQLDVLSRQQAWQASGRPFEFGAGPYVARHQLLGYMGDSGSPGVTKLRYDVMYKDIPDSQPGFWACRYDPYVLACLSGEIERYFFSKSKFAPQQVAAPVYKNP